MTRKPAPLPTYSIGRDDGRTVIVSYGSLRARFTPEGEWPCVEANFPQTARELRLMREYAQTHFLG